MKYGGGYHHPQGKSYGKGDGYKGGGKGDGGKNAGGYPWPGGWWPSGGDGKANGKGKDCGGKAKGKGRSIKGNCHNCGEQGHMAVDCTKPRLMGSLQDGGWPYGGIYWPGDYVRTKTCSPL